MDAATAQVPRKLLRSLRDRTGAGFALRLVLSFAATLVVVGLVGFAFIDRELKQTQIHRFADAQARNARTFERYGRTAPTTAQAIAQIQQVLDALAEQEGTLETLLIDRSGTVRASGNEMVIGEHDMDSRVAGGLRGVPYAGHEGDQSLDSADFEFIEPVNLPDGRYAFEVSYDHTVLNASLADVRHGLALAGLLALLGGSGVFYLFGGRALLRSHRAALQRATIDGLTDLPNQRAFHDEYPQALSAAVRNSDPLALIALDVDDFKFINDRHGHPHGDAILRRVAEVLARGRPGDRAYRIGGDEFALLLPHTDADGACVLARRLARELQAAGVRTSMGASATRAGITSDLRAEADAALYEAKRRGGNQAAHFEDLRERVEVIGSDKRAAVRRILERQVVTTVYQPIKGIADGQLLGYEALSRFEEETGVSGPAEAFDIAEQIARVHELDVLCAAHALTRAPELPDGALLFLNICPRTLDLDADGNDWLVHATRESGLDPARVVVELTERFGGRSASIVRCLRRLHDQGFKLAIDDVGTGNSGLALLREVDVDFIKIDRTIVSAAPTDSGARAVLMAIAAYAHQTQASVIAEGIEDDETLEFLQRIDEPALLREAVIRGGQGYRLGRPAAMPEAADRTSLERAA